MIFSARCGYQPGSMAGLLERMVRSRTISSNDHYTPEQNQKRLDNLKKIINSSEWKGDFNNFEQRWQAYMKYLK
jgi:hypothetical protein